LYITARACLAARVMMLRGCQMRRIPDGRQHQHIFTFNRDAFDSKAGSGMCLPLRVLTLQHKDAVRYIWLEAGWIRARFEL
jgi:hypothetical protein